MAQPSLGTTVQLEASDGATIGAYLARPPGKARAGLVVVQEIFGVNRHIRSVCDRFAEAGYCAISPAFFDRVEPGIELDYDEAGVARGRELVAKVGFDQAVADVKTAAERVQGSGKVAVVGYCWGGTVALLANTRLKLPAISYYGGRSIPFLKERAQAPLLFHFGERDPLIPPAHVTQIRDAYPRAEVRVYLAGHGFNCDQREDYDPQSAAIAFERSLAFLAKHVG